MVFRPFLDVRLDALPPLSFTIALFAAPILYAVFSWRTASTKVMETTSTTNTPAKILPDIDTSNIQVTKILVHPIKSCRGSSVQQANYTLDGLEHDRKWCIVKAESHFVLTARECGKTVLIHPEMVADPSSPEGGQLRVSFPKDSGCETFAIPLKPSQETLQTWKSLDDVELWGRNDIDGFVCETSSGRSPSAIISDFVGIPVLLIMKGPRLRPARATVRFPNLAEPTKYQDGFPMMVLSEESVKELETRIKDMVGVQGVDEKWAQEKVDIERFRPNIVFKGAGVPFAEDSIAEFTIDSNREVADSTAPVVTLVCKCTRCLLPNVDIRTGIRDKAVPYKVMIKFRKGLAPEGLRKSCMGCNGIVSGSGTVKVGDWVHVRKRVDV